ncbi:MAG TPA: hypothetical protein VMD59_16545 [Acidimicrobiales bacterium]|nr:hypothetical protein [Acidimicrobiales bacterium]
MVVAPRTALKRRASAVLGTLACLLLAAGAPARAALAGAPARAALTTAEQQPFPKPGWVLTFGQVALSSPAVAVIDGVTALVFASENGYVYVVDAATGQLLPGWPQPVELGGTAPTAIESSPTVADLDGPGQPPSIIVGAGSSYVSGQNGGLVVFRASGRLRFVFRTQDVFNEWTGSPNPSGYDNAVFSTPAVGDLTGDGEEDIVFGSWDHEIYALTPQGTMVPGFPIDNGDTVWSSPALSHVRGRGRAEDLFIGGDASGRGGCFGGFVMDWSYSGGAPHLRWEHCEDQTVWSSPAVGPIGPGGAPAVVVGTGFGEKPPYPAGTDRVYAFDAASGQPLPGWPVTTAGPVFGSPAIGTLPGSPTPAVIDTSWCLDCTGLRSGASMVYAWSGSGSLLWSQTLEGAEDFASPVVVDLSGDGSNDVLVGSSAGLFPLDGATGDFLFQTSETKAINNCSVQNSPVVAEVSGSWQLFDACGGPKEVAPVGRLFDYTLPATPGTPPPWPMWRGDQDHDGVPVTISG